MSNHWRVNAHLKSCGLNYIYFFVLLKQFPYIPDFFSVLLKATVCSSPRIPLLSGDRVLDVQML